MVPARFIGFDRADLDYELAGGQLAFECAGPYFRRGNLVPGSTIAEQFGDTSDVLDCLGPMRIAISCGEERSMFVSFFMVDDALSVCCRWQ
jgi:hypothetical protein